MEKFSAQPPLLAGYADSTPQKFVRNVCVLHAGRKFWGKHHDLRKNLSLNCPNSSLPKGEGLAPNMTANLKRTPPRVILAGIFTGVGSMLGIRSVRNLSDNIS